MEADPEGAGGPGCAYWVETGVTRARIAPEP
jgi:hypothetical protein